MGTDNNRQLAMATVRDVSLHNRPSRPTARVVNDRLRHTGIQLTEASLM